MANKPRLTSNVEIRGERSCRRRRHQADIVAYGLPVEAALRLADAPVLARSGDLGWLRRRIESHGGPEASLRELSS